MLSPPPIKESTLILLVGLIQFFNILDFMMVMPLGPDFAAGLDIPTSDIGLIGGIYTFAAAVTGLVTALYLDQFSRKKALIFCLAGLVAATFAGALVWSKDSMLVARLVAGMFGGPVTSLAQALIADYIPPERRGRAMGKVAGAFAAASVLGVPFGLELATRFSWHAPFVVTGLLGMAVTALVIAKLPYHKPLASPHGIAMRARGLLAMFRMRMALMSYLLIMLAMMSGFMIIPNIAAHLQLNIGYPREDLGILYFFGGLVSFFSMRGAGWLVDKSSATLSVCLFTGLLLLALATGFVWYANPVPIVVIFVIFMVAMSGRMVSIQTASSKIPAPHERGAYMSVQSALMHLGSATGAYYSSLVLIEADGRLLHVEQIGLTAIGLSVIVPMLVWRVERLLKLRHLENRESIPVVPVQEAAV